MDAITRQFILPMQPQVAAQLPAVYPWEHTELAVICQRLYTLASKTGFNGTFEDFKEHFGLYLESHNIFSSNEFQEYCGEYEVTPLPLVQQILQTQGTVLQNNIVIQPIPYHEVDNNAGGRTVTIG